MHRKNSFASSLWLSVLLVCCSSANGKPTWHREKQLAKPTAEATIYSFSNTTSPGRSHWTGDPNVSILGTLSADRAPSLIKPDEQLQWNISAEASRRPEEFLSWACWNLLQPQQPVPEEDLQRMRQNACSHLDARRSYVVHLVHWGRLDKKLALTSSAWFLYKAKDNYLVRERSGAIPDAVFNASTETIFFGIHVFDAVTDDERSHLLLNYKAITAQVVPEIFRERPLIAQAEVPANAELEETAGYRDVLVIAGMIPGAERPYKLAFSASLTLAKEQTEPFLTLRGHTLSLPVDTTPVSRTAQFAASSISLTLVMRHSDELRFETFVHNVNDPKSPLFGKFLPQSELADKYGPDKDTYYAVVDYLKRHDFQDVQISFNRLTISFAGSRDLVERAFAVSLEDYKLGEKTFFATKNNPSVPAALAVRILAIVGLSSLASPQPGISQTIPPKNAPEHNPVAVSTAYDFPGVGDGGGQTIALLEYDNFATDDLRTWLSSIPTLPASAIDRVKPKPVHGGSSIRTTKGEGEVLLDLEIVVGMAPQATYAVYVARDSVSFHDMFNAMINDNVSVISNSWSECESTIPVADLDGLETILASAAGSGISVFNASGDAGPVCTINKKTDVTTPSDVPSAMGVGGTSLLVGSGNSYLQESWYSKSGFGTSAHFSSPTYFKGALQPGARRRPVPDFAADADEDTGISVYQADMGGWYDGSGTSMSAPIWAAATAILNQHSHHSAGLVISWVASTRCAQALHSPQEMKDPNNDFVHLGFGSIDLAKLAAVQEECKPTHP
jgi:Pro-kumamolisin, activation domain/Subtilase family